MDDDAEVLTDDDELLFRQVHPCFVRDGRPSGQAFRPTPKDAGKLSVAGGALTTVAAPYRHYAERLCLPSAGTGGVTVGECREHGLRAVADPLTAPPATVADPAHAVIDFTGDSRSQAEAKGTRLARKAHGCTPRPGTWPSRHSAPAEPGAVRVRREMSLTSG
jgi:hypothetical protein